MSQIIVQIFTVIAEIKPMLSGKSDVSRIRPENILQILMVNVYTGIYDRNNDLILIAREQVPGLAGVCGNAVFFRISTGADIWPLQSFFFYVNSSKKITVLSPISSYSNSREVRICGRRRRTH